MQQQKLLIAGNWKMNGLSSDLVQIEQTAAFASTFRGAEILLCPPATLIASAVKAADGRIGIGGQDCHCDSSGPFTGDISAEMLKDAGADTVIVGHSERRRGHGETNEMVSAKAAAAWRAGLKVIICVGESESERAAAWHLKVCKEQLSGSVPDEATPTNTAIAYEPVWAIGTGSSATGPDIEAMHEHIRQCLSGRFGHQGASFRILYGGSVKPGNAREILSLPHVSGALVGGASLAAAEFCAIAKCVP